MIDRGDWEWVEESYIPEEFFAEYQAKVEEELMQPWAREELAHGAQKDDLEAMLWKDFDEWLQAHLAEKEFYKGEDEYDALRECE